MSGTIPSDTPSTGVIRIIDIDSGATTSEIRYTYTSWTTSTFSGLSPALVVNYVATGNTDTAYVPYIDKEVGAGVTTESVSVTYVADRTLITRVRKYQSTVASIIPFAITGTLGTAGYSTAAIRTTDTIVG